MSNIQDIARLKSEIVCWKNILSENRISKIDKKFFEEAIKKNEKKIVGLKEE